MANPFNVNDMIAASNVGEFDASSIFRKNPVSGKVASETPAPVKVEIDDNLGIGPDVIEEKPVKKKEVKEWVPDADVLASAPETTKESGIVYDKSEYKEVEDRSLQNISDVMVSQGSAVEKSEMLRIAYNIREACFRNKIRELHIPEMCPERLSIINCASGKDVESVSKNLDEILSALAEQHPDWITKKFDDEDLEKNATQKTDEHGNIINPGKSEDGSETRPGRESVVIVIDKSKAEVVEFTEDELEKLKKARSIELKIKEKGTINFKSIKRAPSETIDRILKGYKPQINGMQISLPASRYRCTISGLSFPDLIEITTDRELNDQDSARSIWGIIFKHIHNPSIGDWEAYTTYYDASGEFHKVKEGEEVPEDAINVHSVTEFEDFMRKTCYVDQSFILWNMLCLTASDKEFIRTICLNSECQAAAEFAYNPADVLDKESISDIVSHEMETTRTVSGQEEIMKWYDEGLLRSDSVVELPDSKFLVRYGLVSAWTYVEDLYEYIAEAKLMRERINEGDISDRGSFGRSETRLMMPSIISFIIPDPENEDDVYTIDKPEDHLRILESLSYKDWAAVGRISSMSQNPYEFRYSLGTHRCPKCGSRNKYEVRSVESLLFLIIDLLEGMQVSLTV